MDDHVLDLEGARALCDLTTRLVIASEAPQMAEAIAETAHGVVGATYAQLGLLSTEGEFLVLYHGAALHEAAHDEWPIVPLDVDTPVSRVMSTGWPLAINSADELIARFPVVRAATEASGYQSLIVVPILDPLNRSRRTGTLSVAWSEPLVANDRSVEILQDLADRCAIALAALDPAAETCRGERDDREVVLALQRSLLPSLRVDHPRMEVASRYIPSNDALVVGGDWYSSVPLSDGRVVFAIGDVAGHGFEAALAMGQIRNDFEALAAHHRGPIDLLDELDYYVQKRDAPMTTAEIISVDPDRRVVTAAAAGHPPPILKRKTTAALLEHSLVAPLGTGLRSQNRPGHVSTTVARGDTLVLYTDGLIERRGESILVGIERVRGRTESLVSADLEAFCDDLVNASLAGESPCDDVALLAVRFL